METVAIETVGIEVPVVVGVDVMVREMVDAADEVGSPHVSWVEDDGEHPVGETLGASMLQHVEEAAIACSPHTDTSRGGSSRSSNPGVPPQG